ncbi:MAG: dihydropteroate synthase [Campylobacter sp.]|nr:dihydropteroate synthase [Campylobacter sp.]
MKFYKINDDSDFGAVCKAISPSVAGLSLMAKKSHINFIFIDGIGSPAANILKQDALSVGAELVTHKDTILGREESSNALLMGTCAQFEILAEKEKLQDFGLKELAKFLKLNFKKPKKPQIMGVVNINDDSFNAQSRINTQNGIARIEAMIEQGAEYIDLGGVSSRPGSEYCGKEEEFRRIKDIIAEIYRLNLHEKAKFSLDSFDEYCLEYALDHGFKMINDITANVNLAALAVKYDCEYALMHMQNSPENMQLDPKYDDLIDEIDKFFESKITQIRAIGCKKIVLDVGIGFGKTAEHNLLLIKHLEHFLHFDLPILIGASRKSVINHYFKSEISERLPGSLYLHLKAYENGAQIIRTHDVHEHAQMFAMHDAMKNINLWR